MRALAAYFILAFSAAASSSGALASSLCKPNERVVFSCSTGEHIASVCASKVLSKTKGYLQYRNGRRDAIDLAYPDISAKPADVFLSGALMFSGGGGGWLRFEQGPFAYTIFTAIGKWGAAGAPSEVAGVAVQKAGKEFASFPCRTEPESEIGPELFETLGLTSPIPADLTFRTLFFESERGGEPNGCLGHLLRADLLTHPGDAGGRCPAQSCRPLRQSGGWIALGAARGSL